MIVDNGSRQALTIDGVFEGQAGVSGSYLSFVPNRGTPSAIAGGVLNGKPVLLWPVKDAAGPFWTARFEVVA